MRRLIRCLLLCSVLGVAPQASAGLTQLTNLFVFGDSLSDSGNSGRRTVEFTNKASEVFPPDPPYFNGQYSNGPVAVQYLWSAYNGGEPSAFGPSLSGGTNYAIGGATSGSANFNSVNPLVPVHLQPAFDDRGAAWQLQEFAADAPAFDPATSLFVVWFFPNDVFFAGQTGMLPGAVPGSPGGANVVENGIANILAIIQTLAMAGAEHFLVPNMPDLGTTPAFLGTPQGPALSGLTAAFNANLALALDLLDAALPIEIVQLNVAAILEGIISNPEGSGFTNVTQSCVANLRDCDPSTWLFWDDVHPTTAAHELLGTLFAQAVPAPATLALVVLGLAALGLGRRRRPKMGTDPIFHPIARCLARVLAGSLLTGAALPAGAALIGPTPYLGFANSPFFLLPGLVLEDFEDGSLNAPGVSAVGTGICVTNTTGCFLNSTAVDSVDEDDGAIDGNGGLPGHSLFASFPAGGDASIRFFFDAMAPGGLPTAAGIVWTDGGFGPANLITFEAFDQSGSSLGTLTGTHADFDNQGAGSAAEDRFYGATHAGGISSILLMNSEGGIEMDHLQFGFLALSVPEPSPLALIGLALAALGLCRRRKMGTYPI